MSVAVPLVKSTDDNNLVTEVNVIAGSLQGSIASDPAPFSWAANPENEVAIWTIKMQANAVWEMPPAIKEVGRTLYFYKGSSMQIDGEQVSSYHAIEVATGESIKLAAGDEDCYLLMLQGKPINEPVAKYGPFVMNTEEEIQEAFADYRRTEFGGWPWPRRDQVHGKDTGRFAKYADGTEEAK